MIIELIEQAVADGPRRVRACTGLDLSCRTLRCGHGQSSRNRSIQDCRGLVAKPPSHVHALSQEQCQ